MPPRDEIDFGAPGSVLGRGLAWPLREDEATGDLARLADEDHVQSCLENLINTPQGLVPGEEDLGTAVEDLLFEAELEAQADLVGESVRRAIQRYEPRVSLLDIRFHMDRLENNRVVVYCMPRCRIKRTGQTILPTFPFSLRTREE